MVGQRDDNDDAVAAIWIDNGFDQAGSEHGRVLSDTRRRL